MAAHSDSDEAFARALHERTRRHFFNDCGVGLGAVALSSFLAGDNGAIAAGERDGAGNSLVKGTTAEPRPRSAGGAAGASSCPGEERDLLVHGGWSQPARAIRLQARASEI